MSETPVKKRGGDVDCTTVVERLRMLARVIASMRYVTPGGDAFETPVGKLSVPKAHDQMVTEFIVFAKHWLGPMDLDFPVNAYTPEGCIELVATWKRKGTADTAVAQSGEGT